MSDGHLSELTAIADGMPGIAKAMVERNNEVWAKKNIEELLR